MENFSISELISLRNWILNFFNVGLTFVTPTPQQLVELKEKLKNIDEEMLNRILKKEIKFKDENFEETVNYLFGSKKDE